MLQKTNNKRKMKPSWLFFLFSPWAEFHKLSRWHPNVQPWIAVNLYGRKSTKWMAVSSWVYMYNFFCFVIFGLKLAFGEVARARWTATTGVRLVALIESDLKKNTFLFLHLSCSEGNSFFSVWIIWHGRQFHNKEEYIFLKLFFPTADRPPHVVKMKSVSI